MWPIQEILDFLTIQEFLNSLNIHIRQIDLVFIY